MNIFRYILVITFSVSPLLTQANQLIGMPEYHYNSLTVKAYYQERGIDTTKSIEYTNLDSKKHTINLRNSHKYNKGIHSQGKKSCITYSYETGILITIRPISKGDVYLEAEVTIFNDIDNGLDYVDSYECGDVYTHNVSRQAKQVKTTLIMDTPKILVFNEKTKVGLLLN